MSTSALGTRIDGFVIVSINSFLSPVKYMHAEDGAIQRSYVFSPNLKQLYIVSTLMTRDNLPCFISFSQNCPLLEELYIDVSSLINIRFLYYCFLIGFTIPYCLSSIHQNGVGSINWNAEYPIVGPLMDKA